MPLRAKFVHTNIIAEDWRKLAEFYKTVFGCRELPPVRDYRGGELERGTGIDGARLQGVHLLLPGYDSDEPTLEIFTYHPMTTDGKKAVNRTGLAHIAFQVEDVERARREVVKAGGREIGEIVTLEIAGGDRVTWCYVGDNEGNVVELQSWEKRSSGAAS